MPGLGVLKTWERLILHDEDDFASLWVKQNTEATWDAGMGQAHGHATALQANLLLSERSSAVPVICIKGRP